MMKVKVDPGAAVAFLGAVEKRFRPAVARALNNTAFDARKEVTETMKRVFDKPTPWTLRSTYVKTANAATLAATIYVRDRWNDPASRDTAALYVQVFGGKRGRKASETALMRKAGLGANEFLVPATDTPRDAFGNVPTGVIRQILSQLQAAEIYGPRGGYTANVRKGAAQSAQSKRRQQRAGTFFIPRPGSGLPRGIYRRKRAAGGWTTEMIFKIVRKRPSYRVRLPLQDIVRRYAAQHFDRQLDRAIRYEVESGRLTR